MHRVAGDCAPFQRVSQLAGEQDVAQLAVAVPKHLHPGRGVVGYRGAQGAEIHSPVAISHRGHGDHAASLCLLQTLQQQSGQQEVTQVIDSEVQLEAVSGLAMPSDPCRRRARAESRGQGSSALALSHSLLQHHCRQEGLALLFLR